MHMSMNKIREAHKVSLLLSTRLISITIVCLSYVSCLCTEIWGWGLKSWLRGHKFALSNFEHPVTWHFIYLCGLIISITQHAFLPEMEKSRGAVF